VNEHDFEHRVLAAQGYTELGMFADALAELDGIEKIAAPQQPAILEMRVLILMRMKKWRNALELSRQLCEAAPESGAGFVHAAFCLHELGRSADASAVLRAGPLSLQTEPVFHYNLACYECALGNLDEARTHLARSFSMDKKYRDFAKNDPDLEPLRRDD